MTNSVTFPVSLGCDGSTVDDSESPTTGLDAGGHATRFVPALSQTILACQAAVSAASAASGTTAATSTTSIAIGTGSKTFTTAASVAGFIVGNYVRITSAANSANYMYGQITGYSSTTLIVNVTDTGGSGTHTDWNITLSGFKGATGPAGAVDTTAQTGLLKGNGSVISVAVSGTDIKTINGTTILGSGNISVGDKFATERAVRRGRQLISQ